MVDQIPIASPEIKRRKANAILASLQQRLDAYDALILTGPGDPEGVVDADIPAIYLRTDGGVGSTLYVKEADSGLNTGWAAK